MPTIKVGIFILISNPKLFEHDLSDRILVKINNAIKKKD